MMKTIWRDQSTALFIYSLISPNDALYILEDIHKSLDKFIPRNLMNFNITNAIFSTF